MVEHQAIPAGGHNPALVMMNKELRNADMNGVIKKRTSLREW